MFKQENTKNIINDFTCPITGLLMINPVDTVCKHSFEKEALEQYLQHLKNKGEDSQENDDTPASKSEPELPCPICRHNLRDTEIKPNKELKQSISEMIKTHPEVLAKLYCEEAVLLALEKAITEHDASLVTTLISLNKQAFYHKLPTQKFFPVDIIIAIHNNMMDAFIKGLEEHASFALQWQNEGGYNAFHAAVLVGNTTMATEIYAAFNQQDVVLKLQTGEGFNILHLACQSNKIEMAQWVLKLLGDQAKDAITHASTKFLNPLMIACYESDAHMVTMLLNYYLKEQDEGKIFTKLLSNNNRNAYSIALNNKCNQGFFITLELNTFLDKLFGKEKREAFVSYCDRKALLHSRTEIHELIGMLAVNIKRYTEENTNAEEAASRAVADFARSLRARSPNDHEDEPETEPQEVVNPGNVPQALFASSSNIASNPMNTTAQPQSSRERSFSN